MQKRFNIAGLCIPELHYMVDICDRLCEIRKMVEIGDYFAVNRGRQYGKTTTLSLLKNSLEDKYTVFFISFEGLGENAYLSEEQFNQTFLQLLEDTIQYEEVKNISPKVKELIHDASVKLVGEITQIEISRIITRICEWNDKPVVLMIDEVDQASNYKSFLSFLGILRDKYLKRMNRPTFQSVILAGVYDIKNLKLKIRNEQEHQYNSPWNIAAKFLVDMSFSVKDIQKMLNEYDQDYQIGMNIEEVAELIYEYTSGYPYLVSEICKIMDEQLVVMGCFENLSEIWTRTGVLEAVKVLLSESNTLFDDMRKKLEEFEELRNMLYKLLFEGQEYAYNGYNFSMDIAHMFSYIRNQNGKAKVDNRIFETWLYNWFISEETTNRYMIDAGVEDRSQFIENGRLNMQCILERFVVHFTDLYGDNEEAFIEKVGRKYFLFYIKPIINGTGNYYIEAQTRDSKRTDVIIDYLGQQYIIEMKIWHGKEYNSRGEQQLLEYLEAYHLDKGYMLSFNFNKKKEVGVKNIQIGDKVLVEAVV